MREETQTTTPLIEIAPVEIYAVHDADSLTLTLPLHGLWPEIDGNGLRVKTRVAHCNAAELDTQDGKDALAQVLTWLGKRDDLKAIGYGREKYGRWLADVVDETGETLSAFVLGLQGSKPLAAREQLI